MFSFCVRHFEDLKTQVSQYLADDFRRENWESQAFEKSLLTLFKIGVYFPYNIMLVSAVQRSELAICIRISCLSDLPFPHLSLLGHPKARS